MKTRYRKTLIGIAVATAIGVTGAAFAHGGGNWSQGTQGQQGYGNTETAMGMGDHGAMHGKDGRGMGMMGGMMHGQDGRGMGMMTGMMGSGGMQHGMGFGFGLDLSDEQKAEMGKIREEILPLMGELRGKMQANNERLHALRQSDGPDMATIADLADRKGDLIAEMIKLRARQHEKLQVLLSDEQREQMREHRQGKGGTQKMGS